MIRFIVFLSVCGVFCNTARCQEVVAYGQMPNIVANEQQVYLTYGRHDSILYSRSNDFGKSFSKEVLVSVLKDLAASHTRGPQIAVTSEGVVVTACSSRGDIFSFLLDYDGKVRSKSRVNDADTCAKENLMALSADGANVFAVWLDARTGHNQIYGASSTNGGKSWNNNIKVYSSPDTTVCECCKPSVEVHGTRVYVMFRNWLNGYRDLYLARSADNGASFGDPQKVGFGAWKLAGCPMDGGSFTVDPDNSVTAVFNRRGTIFACTVGNEEKQLGSGRSCTMDATGARKAFAWVENGSVVYLNAVGRKTTLGQGQLPVLKVVDSTHAICVWENDKRVMKAIVAL
jgi:hypothetical protein